MLTSENQGKLLCAGGRDGGRGQVTPSTPAETEPGVVCMQDGDITLKWPLRGDKSLWYFSLSSSLGTSTSRSLCLYPRTLGGSGLSLFFNGLPSFGVSCASLKKRWRMFHLPLFHEKVLTKIRIISSALGRIHIIQLLCVFLPSMLGTVPPYVPHALSPWSKIYSFSKPSPKRGPERYCWGGTAPGIGDIHISPLPPSLVSTCHTV